MIHRDIKPENFLIGLKPNKNTIYLVDFGLAKRFRDPSNGEHIPYRDGKHMTGTVRYASIYTHLGIEQSRRDDLESLVYNMLYFCNGDLPWQGIKAKNQKEKYNKIMERKISLTPNRICEKYPFEISTILEYTRCLQFEEKPDYGHIRSILQSMKNRLDNSYREDSSIFYWERFLTSSNNFRINSDHLKKIDYGKIDEEINL